MKKLPLTLLLAGSLLATSASKAADFDFSGSFTKDNDITSLFFTVGAPSTVTIFSSSWVTGGFDPILSIWDSAGNKVAEQDDGHEVGSTFSNGISYNHGDWDSYFMLDLDGGTYRAVIGQFSNFANGDTLAEGFIYDDSPHFTTAFGPQPDFNGVLNDTDGRTADWAFHVLNVQAARVDQVPDASATLGLLLVGLGALVSAQRRLQRRA